MREIERLVQHPGELLFAGACTVAGILLVIILNKKLRIFTKGSVTFMVVVLMITAFFSAVEKGNDVRNGYRSARAAARRNVCVQFLREALEGERDRLAGRLDPADTARILGRVDDLHEDIKHLAGCDAVSHVCDVESTRRLMSLGVDVRWYDDAQDEFTALVSMHDQFLVVTGELTLADEPLRVADVRAKIRRAKSGESVHLYHSLHDYRSPTYPQLAQPR
jgi:hypothetical protein